MAKLVEKNFSFLLQKGYSPPQINIQTREFFIVYKPTYPKHVLLSIIYDGYGLPYVQITPLWLITPQGITRTFALIEVIKQYDSLTFKTLSHYSKQKNTLSQLDFCLEIMVRFLKIHSSKILSPDTMFVEKIELSR